MQAEETLHCLLVREHSTNSVQAVQMHRQIAGLNLDFVKLKVSMLMNRILTEGLLLMPVLSE